MAKATKAQRDFFDTFSKNVLVNSLLIKLESEGTTLPQETVQQIIAVIDASDVSVLSQALGDKMLELVDFKTLVKVEKFLNSPEAKQALAAAQQVGAMVQDEVYAVLGEIFAVPPEAE